MILIRKLWVFIPRSSTITSMLMIRRTSPNTTLLDKRRWNG
jgi:hypothetical protein